MLFRSQDAAGAVTAAPAWRVNLELLRLDSTPAREARLDAQWAIAAVPPAAGNAAPAWRVNLELLRLDSTPAREARLDAQWAIVALPAAAGQAAAGCRATLRQAVSAGTVALADGHRRIVARLADRMGQHLRALSRGEAPPCMADE